MNCVSRVLPHFAERQHRLALWTVQDGDVSFGELAVLTARAQALARDEGLRQGEPVLLLATPGAPLFAAILGLLGLGVPVVFVEPWMPVADVEHLIRVVRPRAFLCNTLGQVWGARVRAVRDIPRWIHVRRLARQCLSGPFQVEDVDAGAPALITFTSGTTGRPKGIVRTHACLPALQDILTGSDARDRFDGPDLCVFPNVALLHLATGRGALLVPPDWNERALRRIQARPAALQPRTLSCGPAFLLHLLRSTERSGGFERLQSVSVGGALTDCAIFERAFERWSGAEWRQIYGGAEAEPVAYADARVAVDKSRRRGRFQTLHLGSPIAELRTELSSEGLWVSGANVAAPFVGSGTEHRAAKRVDADGRLWHCMGDRVLSDEDGWWFAGRATQPAVDFDLEQRVYAFLGTSRCFVHRDSAGRAILYGERLRRRLDEAGTRLTRAFPEIQDIRELRIVRDRRHRARIDRATSLERGGYRER